MASSLVVRRHSARSAVDRGVADSEEPTHRAVGHLGGTAASPSVGGHSEVAPEDWQSRGRAVARQLPE
eukprot:2362759-Prymnesium_polylepis.1